MFSKNFQLCARNRKIPGAGSFFYIRGGSMLMGSDYLMLSLCIRDREEVGRLPFISFDP